MSKFKGPANKDAVCVNDNAHQHCLSRVGFDQVTLNQMSNTFKD